MTPRKYIRGRKKPKKPKKRKSRRRAYTVGKSAMTTTVDTANITVMAPAGNKASPTSFNHTCGANVDALIVTITIYDTSADDGVVSAVTYNGADFGTADTIYYDALCDGHVSIWSLDNPDTGESYAVEMTHGGVVTDIEAAAVGIEGTVDTFAVDSTGTPNTGTSGNLTISWNTVATNTIVFSCSLDDQTDVANVHPQSTEIYNVDVGDVVSAQYEIRTQSGSQTQTIVDDDGDEDWVIVGVAYKEVISGTDTSDNTSAFLEGEAAPSIVFTNLGSSANPDIATLDDLDSYTNSSWTPPTTGVILVALRWRQLDWSNEKPKITGNGIDWHLVAKEDAGSGTTCTALYAAFASGSITGVTTFDMLGRTGTFLNAHFSQVTGAYESGSIQDVFAQIVVATGTGVSGTVTLPTAASSGSRPYAIFSHVTAESNTPRANWTELDDLGVGDALQTQYRGDAMETTASASWSTNENWTGIAVEIRLASVTTGLSALGQAYWRLRDEDTVVLNSTTFAAAENTQATILQGKFFRARIKVRRATTGEAQIFKLQARHVPASGVRATSWAPVEPIAASIADGPVKGNLSDQYIDGAATTELLTGPSTFVGGEGVESIPVTGNAITGSYDLDNQETEFEWLLQIVSSYSLPFVGIVKPGDKIYLRVIVDDGSVYGEAFPNLYNEVEILVGENSGYVGATFAELPKKVMHYDGNDNLYYLAEAGEYAPETVMLKSTNRGDTWDFAGNSTRPLETDLESTDMVIAGQTGYIGSQLNDEPYLDTFYFSDHGSTPDTWATQEVIKDPVVRDDQVSATVHRSDGSLIVFFEELVSSYRRITYRIKNGSWGGDNNLDSQGTTDFTDVVAIVGDSDLTHIFYIDSTNGKLYHNTISSADVLGAREEVGTSIMGTGGSEENALAGVVRYDSSGTDRIVVAFKDSSDYISVAKVDDDGSPSSPTTVSDATVLNDPPSTGSDTPIADIIVEGTNLWIIYADDTTHDLWITKSADYGAWDTDVEILDDVDPSFFRMIYFEPSGGGKYIGSIYEEQSYGGNGQGWYNEYEIEAPGGTDTSDNQIAYLKGSEDATPDNQIAYLKGSDNALDNQPAYLNGSADAVDSQDAYAHGSDDAVASKSAFLAGGVNVTSDQGAFLWGEDDAVSSLSAFIQVSETDNQIAYLKGKDTGIESQDAYTRGSIDTTSNLGAFTQGKDTAVASLDSYLFGVIFVSDDLSAFLWGSQDDTDSSYAYLRGSINVSDDQTAYTKGALGTTDSTDAFLWGKDTATDNFSAFLAGGINVLSDTEAFLKGISTATENLSAFLTGGINVDTSTTAYAKGKDTAVGSTDAFLLGGIVSTDDTPAYLKGKDTALSSQDAFLAGGINVTSSKTAYLAGKDSTTGSTTAYLRGSIDTQSTLSSYLRGSQDTSDFTDAYLKGSISVTDNLDAFIQVGVGSSLSVFLAAGTPATDNFSAFLKGVDTAVDNQPAFLVGGINVTDNLDAYLAGGINVEDNISAYLKGKDTASSSRDAFLLGGIVVIDNASAYLKGKDTALSSLLSFLKGGIVVTSSQDAYLAGESSIIGSTLAYLRGSVDTQSSFSSYLRGSQDASSSTDAFLWGDAATTSSLSAFIQVGVGSSLSAVLIAGTEEISNLSAYLSGVDTATSSVDSYLLGGIVSTSSITSYLSGKSTASTSVESYLRGKASTSGSLSAFLAGKDTASDNQIAFLAGQSTATDSMSAYLEGATVEASSSIQSYLKGSIDVTSSQEVYLDGMGERLTPDGDISQSGDWKREDNSTTNLYQSIDEYPGANDADYVWYDNAPADEYFEVSLSDPQYEQIGAGDVKVFWCIRRRAGSQTLTLKMELREGVTVRASDSKALTDTDTTYTYILTSGEKSSITNWSNLRLRFIVESVT